MYDVSVDVIHTEVSGGVDGCCVSCREVIDVAVDENGEFHGQIPGAVMVSLSTAWMRFLA
ncbi:hypothetical protein GCM10027068_12890 [Prescottella soli]